MANKLTEQINAAPEPLKSYIHDLVSGYGKSAEMVQDNILLKDTAAGLKAALDEKEKDPLTAQMKLALGMIRGTLCEVEDYCNRGEGRPFYYLTEKARLTIEGFNMAFGGILPERGGG